MYIFCIYHLIFLCYSQDTDEKYDLVLVANDALCEKIGSNLDELSGKTKSSAPVLIESSISTNEVIKSFSSTGTGSWNRKSTSTVSIIIVMFNDDRMFINKYLNHIKNQHYKIIVIKGQIKNMYDLCKIY